MAQAAYPPSREGSYPHSRSGGPRANPMLPEQMIGSYVIRETIGRGSFGKVKKGRHVHTGEYVAIKILNRQKLKSANMDKKIHREIEILQLFSHPNICRLYEVISTPTDMYLIMEYVEGGELYDYIVQKGRVRESEARYIFQQIVCAIEYCHHFRVVHRDLKPENILLGTGLQVKLIDFGLSNITKDGEFLATSCGSPNYAAPEVISGKLYFGPEVDVWSCGVILYALLCGCLPFDEDSIPLLFSKIKKGKYAIPSNMQTGPRELIQQILVVDPLVRLTVPQIRDNAWFNQRLPMRLSYSESIFSVKEDRILSVLVSETAKRLGVRDRDVRKELELGYGAAFVAYNILLDARRRREIAAEVRELGMSGDESRGVSHVIGAQQTKFQPKATERELNMGLMLTQSPAMVVLLDEEDATRNKWAYNRGCFVPASVATLGDPTKVSDTSLSDGSGNGGPGGSIAVGSFRITSKMCSGSLVGSGSVGSSSYAPGSLRGAAGLTGGSSSYRRAGMQSSTGGTAASQLGANLSDQPRVGSVARKHAMYTAEEEQFIVENNYGWRIGIMTDWRAEQALSAIYDVLRTFKMQWKVVSPFRLLARSTAETWSVVADSTQSRNASTRRNTLSTYSVESSAPIRIGCRSGAPGSGSSDDHEDGDIAGSMQRDEECIHAHITRTRRAGAAARSFGSAPGGGFNTSSSQVARGNYFGGLQGGDEEAAIVSGSAASGVLQSAHAIESGSESTSSPRDPRGASPPASAAASTSAIAEPASSPANPVVISLYFFRIHERHDKGYLVDFKVVRNAMVAADLVLLLSDTLVRKLG
ncbi:5'-AMP-activated protein kinase catalytic subunit alpha / AMPKa [Leishmania donovani]|uniref:5'-AMP-activated_protein_kinase_catalytic_subunit _alpha n=1 Tax=Leishmania donovani TaxID=5661 RepID=A0A504XZX0_LEIDO|nr:Protein kinase domain family protein [Leishmania donovani]CAJ1990689.1 5'-AMP-activated protein kinase catalytic subunit alpha / AMPKa [Leishmania donovani]VDZ46542.1 5'-AMP-activated_protein_kinase_catalytic_subunit_alpha [Leishmania donovani]